MKKLFKVGKKKKEEEPVVTSALQKIISMQEKQAAIANEKDVTTFPEPKHQSPTSSADDKGTSSSEMTSTETSTSSASSGQEQTASSDTSALTASSPKEASLRGKKKKNKKAQSIRSETSASADSSTSPETSTATSPEEASIKGKKKKNKKTPSVNSESSAVSESSNSPETSAVTSPEEASIKGKKNITKKAPSVKSDSSTVSESSSSPETSTAAASSSPDVKVTQKAETITSASTQSSSRSRSVVSKSSTSSPRKSSKLSNVITPNEISPEPTEKPKKMTYSEVVKSPVKVVEDTEDDETLDIQLQKHSQRSSPSKNSSKSAPKIEDQISKLSIHAESSAASSVSNPPSSTSSKKRRSKKSHNASRDLEKESTAPRSLPRKVQQGNAKAKAAKKSSSTESDTTETTTPSASEASSSPVKKRKSKKVVVKSSIVSPTTTESSTETESSDSEVLVKNTNFTPKQNVSKNDKIERWRESIQKQQEQQSRPADGEDDQPLEYMLPQGHTPLLSNAYQGSENSNYPIGMQRQLMNFQNQPQGFMPGMAYPVPHPQMIPGAAPMMYPQYPQYMPGVYQPGGYNSSTPSGTTGDDLTPFDSVSNAGGPRIRPVIPQMVAVQPQVQQYPPEFLAMMQQQQAMAMGVPNVYPHMQPMFIPQGQEQMYQQQAYSQSVPQTQQIGRRRPEAPEWLKNEHIANKIGGEGTLMEQVKKGREKPKGKTNLVGEIKKDSRHAGAPQQTTQHTPYAPRGYPPQQYYPGPYANYRPPQ